MAPFIHRVRCSIDRATVLDNHNAFALVSLIIPVVRPALPRSIKRVARIVSVNASRWRRVVFKSDGRGDEIGRSSSH